METGARYIKTNVRGVNCCVLWGERTKQTPMGERSNYLRCRAGSGYQRR